MPGPPTFEQVCGEIREFRQVIDRALAKGGDAAVRQHLERVTRTLDKNFDEMLEVYPKAVAELDKEQARTQAMAAQVQKQIQEMEAQVAAEKAAKEKAAGLPAPAQPIPAPKAPAPVDPKLGVTLRRELLERYAKPAEPGPVPAPGLVREAWEDWSPSNRPLR